MRISGGQRQRVGSGARHRGGGARLCPDCWSGRPVLRRRRRHRGPHRRGAQAGVRHRRAAQDRVTIVVCSHRLAAFPVCGSVVVLRDGRIDANWERMPSWLASEGLYARIFRAQLNAESRRRSTGRGDERFVVTGDEPRRRASLADGNLASLLRPWRARAIAVVAARARRRVVRAGAAVHHSRDRRRPSACRRSAGLLLLADPLPRRQRRRPGDDVPLQLSRRDDRAGRAQPSARPPRLRTFSGSADEPPRPDADGRHHQPLHRRTSRRWTPCSRRASPCSWPTSCAC